MARKAKVEIYRSGVGYRWRLVGGNGEKCTGGEGHPTPANARRAARRDGELLRTAEFVNEYPGARRPRRKA